MNKLFYQIRKHHKDTDAAYIEAMLNLVAIEHRHQPECRILMRKDVIEWLRFTHQYPDYCTNCNGQGIFYTQYDPSPAGVSLGSGYMTDVDLCPRCVNNMLCPWCGSPLKEFNEDDAEICSEEKCWSAEVFTPTPLDDAFCWCNHDSPDYYHHCLCIETGILECPYHSTDPMVLALKKIKADDEFAYNSIIKERDFWLLTRLTGYLPSRCRDFLYLNPLEKASDGN